MERRKFLRFEAKLIAEVKIKANVELNEKGLINDFSREGLKLVLSRLNFKPNSLISLNIYLPQRQVPILALGEVIHTRFNAKKEWEIGVRLKEIDKAEKGEILAHVYEQWRKNLIKKVVERDDKR
jgi:hypothetical protein